MDNNGNEQQKEKKSNSWLIVLIVVVALALVGFGAYMAVYKLTTIYKQGVWGFFGGSKESSNVEKKVNDIFDQAQKEINTQKAELFNSDFEEHMGTHTGEELYDLFDIIITNNKKNSDKTITVVFKENITTNPDEIKNIKRSLDEEHKYEVSLDYDDNGYVNQVTIEE